MSFNWHHLEICRPLQTSWPSAHLITFRDAITQIGEIAKCASLPCAGARPRAAARACHFPSTKQRWNHRRCAGASFRGPEDRGLVTPPTQTHSIRLAQRIGAIDGICCLAAACSSETPYRYILHIKGNSSEFYWFLVAGFLEFPDFTSRKLWDQVRNLITGVNFILQILRRQLWLSNASFSIAFGTADKIRNQEKDKIHSSMTPQPASQRLQAVKRLLIYNINTARKDLRSDPIRATDIWNEWKWIQALIKTQEHS